MTCPKCNAKVSPDDDKYCGDCGTALTLSAKMEITEADATGSKVSDDAGFRSLSIWSVILLASIIFVPMFDLWGGIIPGKYAYNTERIYRIFSESRNPWSYTPVILYMSAFIPAAILLLGSLVKSKILAMIASAAGIIFLVIDLEKFIDKVGSSAVFNFDHCSISIGYWLALALFIVCFLRAKFIKKR